MKIGEFQKLFKRGALLRKIDIRRVETMLAMPLSSLFDSTSSTRPVFFRNNDNLILLEGNHRASMLSVRKLTEGEANIVIDVLEIQCSKRDFDISWKNSSTVDFYKLKGGHGPRLVKDKIANSIRIRSIQYMTDETTKNQAAFSLEELMLVYVDFFDSLIGDSDLVKMRASSEYKKAMWRKMVERELVNDDVKLKMFYDVHCANSKTKKALVEAARDGYKFAGYDFMRLAANASLINDESTSSILAKLRFNKLDTGKGRHMLTQVIDSIVCGKEVEKKRSVMKNRVSANPNEIESLEDAEDGSFVILRHKIPDMEIVRAKKLNLVLIETDLNEARKIDLGGGCGTGKIELEGNKKREFWIVGPSITS